jgi:putative transcriptional regulator
MLTQEKWGIEMRGRINWALIRSQDQDTIDRLAAEEREALGINWDNFKFRVVRNARVPNVKTIRRKLGLTQSQFAKRFCLSQRTVQQWEQGRSKPDQPARILLRVIELAPRIAAQAAHGPAIPRERATESSRRSKYRK